MTMRATYFWTPLIAMSGAAVAIAAWTAGGRGTDYKFFDELIEVKHILSSRYIDGVDDQKLKEGAIRGMVEALDDPYTVYVPPSEQREFNKSLLGEYVGIGAQVNTSTGWLTIVSPLEDSPAIRAGLMPDDKVLEIAGTSTQGVSVEECVALLSGEAGSPVTLKIERRGREFEMVIVRDRVKTRSVKGVQRSESDPQAWDFTLDAGRRIGYIRLSQFTPGVSKEFEAAIASLHAEQGELRGLIIDLRGNPGGLLTEAEAIADMFLREGVIVSTKGGVHEEEVTRARSEGTLPDMPLMLMLNGDSASASEVLAGALGDNNRATILGSRSYGKGSVQSLLRLESGNGSELKVTEQGYFLPSGRSITRKDTSAEWGVDPSPGFYVPMTDDSYFDMLRVRRRVELIHSGAEPADEGTGTQTMPPATTGDSKPEENPLAAPHWSDPDWIAGAFKDVQLSAALRAVQVHVDTGAWQATGGELPQRGAIAADELSRIREGRERLIRELLRADKRIEAIESAAGDVAAGATRDLWPDETDLTGGTLEVKDKDGKVVASLRVTGNNVERWLMDADVEKAGSEQ